MKFRNIIPRYNLKKACVIIGLLWIIPGLCFAQNQELNDSLEIVYKSGKYDKDQELEILLQLAESETNTDKLLTYGMQLTIKAKEADSAKYEFKGYLQQGHAYRLKSELTKALEIYFDAAKVASNNELKSEEAITNIAIADVYSIMGNSPTSVSYYQSALALLAELQDSIELASAQLNLGDEYYNQSNFDSALYFFQESGRIFKAKNYELGEAYNLGNVGLVYAEKGQNEEAEANLNQAIEVLTKLGDYYPICVYLEAMSDVYTAKKNNKKAMAYVEQSLELAKKYDLKEQISDANLTLSSMYEEGRDFKKSFYHYKEHINYRDSVSSVADVQDMANVRTEFEVSQKQMEVDLLNQQKKTQRIIVFAIGLALLLILFLAYGLFRRNKFMKRTNEIIAAEKQRSDDLLKNILPAETAEELKENGSVQAKQFDEVSILFTDFKGFTEQSELMSPEALVESIDFYFSKFDEIMEQYGLEKIKTIGDAYMCAAGLPFPVDDHAVKICQAALDIVEFVRKTKRSINHKLAKFDIRVGINTGPVVAGVVGTTKFQYDIWGDAVNTAARMESSSDVGKVNISESTYNLLQQYDVFEFTERGAIEAKGKGKIKMYFIEYID